MDLFEQWSKTLELKHDRGYENELFIACILLQGAAEGIAERGKELHNLNSVYWSDTMETVSYFALGEHLGCCPLIGDILGKSEFWKLFDVFRVDGCLEQLEAFERRILSEYKEGSVFYELLGPDAPAAAAAPCDAVTAPVPCDAVTAALEPIAAPAPETQRSRFNHTHRIKGRRALTPIKNSTRHHKTPIKSILKKST